MRGIWLTILILAGTAWSSAAVAQNVDACGAFKWSVARELKAFGAADLPTLASGGVLPALGQGASVTLQPQADVAYGVKPSRAPKISPAYGAELTLPPATSAQSIQVTFSVDAWVDVVQAGKVLRSTGFSGKTGCAGVRKSVRFALSPGPAAIAIAISDAPDKTLNIVVEPAE